MTTQGDKQGKTHWRKNFDYRFIAAEELGGEVKVVIKSFSQEEAFNGKTKEIVPVIWFEKTEKGMVLNRTNSKVIARVLNSPYMEDWVGKEITLYPTMVQAFGQPTLAIRVKEDFSKVKV